MPLPAIRLAVAAHAYLDPGPGAPMPLRVLVAALCALPFAILGVAGIFLLLSVLLFVLNLLQGLSL